MKNSASLASIGRLFIDVSKSTDILWR